MTPPEGFEPLFRTSPVVELIGPLFSRGEGHARVIGMYAQEKHCNARGLVHGGILALISDTALGYAMAFATEPPTALVTVSLTIDYAGSARAGDWLQVEVDVQKMGSRVAFANCYIRSTEARIARASAIFSVGKALGQSGK